MNRILTIIGGALLSTLGGCFAQQEPAAVYQKTTRNQPSRDHMVKNNDLRGWRDSGDDIMRRTAFRLLQNSPEHRLASARQGLTDRDPVIRRSSVYSLYESAGEKALPEITRLGQDPDFNVRYMVAVCAAALAKQSNAEAMLYLENTARIDSDIRIRQFAGRALWPYHRETGLLRDVLPAGRPVERLKVLAIPPENWRFQLDPSLTGHLEKWQSATLDDSSWNLIDMGCWEDQGFNGYDGIAWYRIRFNMPETMACSAVQLCFDGVEDSAWVWLNDEYLGQQNLGKATAGTPFQLDATREIRWGQENILVVRVSNSSGRGGIVKPLSLEIYK